MADTNERIVKLETLVRDLQLRIEELQKSVLRSTLNSYLTPAMERWTASRDNSGIEEASGDHGRFTPDVSSEYDWKSNSSTLEADDECEK
jgi:hypothetical protein